jgi:DNA polymerase III delta prime subunit
MPQVTVELDFNKIEQMVRQLNERERQKLIEKLVNEDFEEAVKKFRKNIKKQKLSAKDINRIVENARQEFYDKNRS